MSNLENKRPRVPSALRGFLFLVLIVASLTFGIMNRHWTDWLLYAYVAAMPLAFLFMFREGRMYREAAKTSRDTIAVVAKLALPVPILAIVMLPIGGILYGFAAATIDTLKWAALHFSQNGKSALLAGTVTATLGAIFFAFRLRYRFFYGITEALVGLAVAGHRVGFATPNEPGGNAGLYLAVLTAGVYIVVRGLDNMHQAWVSKSDIALNLILRKPSV